MKEIFGFFIYEIEFDLNIKLVVIILILTV